MGCSGQAILEGIGEFENKWGFELSDSWYGPYIEVQDASVKGKYGTSEFDDVAKRIALEVLKEDPFILVRNSIKRIPQVLCYPLPFSAYFFAYLSNKSFPTGMDKIKGIVADLGVFNVILFLLQKLHVVLVIMLGYLGFILLFKKRAYAFLVLWISAYVGSLGLIISHIELRYIYPVMPLWGVLAGIFCYDAFLYSKKRWFSSAS